MTKYQSSQNRFVQAALTAAALAFALTVLPGTALADALPEDQQQLVSSEEQETTIVEESDGQNTPATEDQVVDNDNDDQVIDTTGDQETNDTEDVQEVVTDTSEVPAADDVADDQSSSDAVETAGAASLEEGDGANDGALIDDTTPEGESAASGGAPLLRAPASGEEGAGEGEEPEPIIPPVADGTYVIQTGVGGISGKQVLDAKGTNLANGTNVQTYTYNGGNNQRWDFTYNSEFNAYVIAAHGTNLVLDVDHGIAENNRNVTLYQLGTGKVNQMWTLSKNGAGWSIVSLIDPGFALDIYRAYNANGTNVALYSYTEGSNKSNQLFYLLSLAPAPSEDAVTDGLYEVSSSVDGNYALDVHGASTANCANVEIYKTNGGVNQRWQLTSDGEGYYTITVVSSGTVLDVDHGSPIPCANILQYSANGGDNQKWALRDNGDGTVSFINKATHLVLDIDHGTMANSTNVLGYRDNGGANQRWTLTPVEYISAGIYEIKPLSNESVSLDMRGGTATESADAMLYRDTNSLNQRFQVVRVGVNQYKIRTGDSGGWLTDDGSKVVQTGSSATESSADVWEAFWNGRYFSLKNTRTNHVVDLAGTVASGTATKSSSASGASSQHFRFVAANLIEPGLYEIHSGINDSFTLDVSGASSAAGANIILWTDKDSANQYFMIEKSGSGFKIISLFSGQAVTGGSSSSANVSQQVFTGASDQIWIPVIADGGFVSFQCVANKDLLLDVAGDSATNLANVEVATSDGSAGQRWKLAAVKIGWYKNAAGHWFYLSADPRAYFENDGYVVTVKRNGKNVEEVRFYDGYDLLYRLWRKVNGYTSGSMKPYGSGTKYLVVSAWDDCYLAVFVANPDTDVKPSQPGYWTPLLGFNCGNGNANVINNEYKRRAAEEGLSGDWTWDPEYVRYLAAGNDSSAAKANLPSENAWARNLTSSNYQVKRVNDRERYFTSVNLTLGYHTILKNANAELYRHVSNGCIRLDVNNAALLYALLAPEGRTSTYLNSTEVIKYRNGQTVVGVGVTKSGGRTRCIQLQSSKPHYSY